MTIQPRLISELFALLRDGIDAYRERTELLREVAPGRDRAVLSGVETGPRSGEIRTWEEKQLPREHGCDNEETDDGCSWSDIEAVCDRKRRSYRQELRDSKQKEPQGASKRA